MSFSDDELSSDRFLDGRAELWQPKHGYRAAMDPVLLAAFTPARSGQCVLDLGCGAGAAAICLGTRVSGLDTHGLEVQKDYAHLAERNARRNATKLTVHRGDALRPPRALKDRTFDHVITNPPYFSNVESTQPSDAGRAVSHIEKTATLSEWLSSGLRRTKQKGWFSLVHRAERLDEILAVFSRSCGNIQVLPVVSRAGRIANRVLVRGRKGSSAKLEICWPLTIHKRSFHNADEVDYTDSAEKILRNMQELLPVARISGSRD